MLKDSFCLKIEVYKKIPEAFKKQVDLLSKICFDNKQRTAREQAGRDDQACSDKDRYSFVLAIENNDVIGKVGVLKRKIIYKGKTIVLGGIGGVCVCEGKRGQGVAKAMLKVAMEEIDRTSCDVAYLNANPEKGPRLYGPFGFVLLKKKYTFLGKSGKRYFEDCGMVAPINSKTIFKEIITDKEPFDIGVGNW